MTVYESFMKFAMDAARNKARMEAAPILGSKATVSYASKPRKPKAKPVVVSKPLFPTHARKASTAATTSFRQRKELRDKISLRKRVAQHADAKIKAKQRAAQRSALIDKTKQKVTSAAKSTVNALNSSTSSKHTPVSKPKPAATSTSAPAKKESFMTKGEAGAVAAGVVGTAAAAYGAHRIYKAYKKNKAQSDAIERSRAQHQSAQ